MWRYLLFLLILFTSCSSNEVAEPTIEVDKMAKILADIHIAEGSFQNTLIIQKDSIASDLYHHVFKQYDITENDFYKNHTAYFSSPVRLEEVYEKVLVEIEARNKSHQPKNRGKSQKEVKKK